MSVDRELMGLSDRDLMFSRLRQEQMLMPAKDQNLADEFYRRLVKWINDFDAELDENHEVGVRLVSFGETIVFHVQDLGYWNPSLICFYGVTDAGNEVQLIQHVSQISILLMKLPRLDPAKPKRKIGFTEENKDKAADDSE